MTRLETAGFEEVHRVDCAGTAAFVAVHYTREGRAFGGVRVAEYADEDSALADAKALAVAMSRKLALAGLRGGGAKAVMMKPTRDREAAIRALGEFVESLGGRYQCGADFGFTEADSGILRQATGHVVIGNLGHFAARTVFIAMSAVCDPRVVAVQGLGAVGRPLAETLRSSGARVIASDLSDTGDFESVEPEAIYDQECVVFSPCARGGVLDSDTVERLRAQVVCGGANNPLASSEIADRLLERGMTYVPGFVANVGAAIKGVSEMLGESDQVGPRMLAVRDLVRELVRRGEWEGRSPHRVAMDMADESIERLRSGT